MQRLSTETASKSTRANGQSAAAKRQLAPRKVPTVRAQSQQLPLDWRVWIAENRLLGATEEQILEILNGSGYPPASIRAEIDEQLDNPLYQSAERATQRYNKLKSLLEVSAQVRSLSFTAESVERRSKVSRSEFLERYYSASRPVILTGMLSGSPARKRWSPEYFASTCGDATVQIMAGRQSDPRYEINSDSHRRDVKLSDYISMVLKGGTSNDYYLVANNHFFERPEFEYLYNEAPRLPEYLDDAEARQKNFLWFGPGGTVTPLHHDLMNVLVAQIYGRKKFTLIAPEYTPYVYNNIGCYSEVDCAKPDYEQYPLFRQAKRLEVIIGPGDVLFIPVGWWHHVHTLDVSIMVSYINFCFPNDFNWFHPNI
jgi:hypothetical protein